MHHTIHYSEESTIGGIICGRCNWKVESYVSVEMSNCDVNFEDVVHVFTHRLVNHLMTDHNLAIEEIRDDKIQGINTDKVISEVTDE